MRLMISGLPLFNLHINVGTKRGPREKVIMARMDLKWLRSGDSQVWSMTGGAKAARTIMAISRRDLEESDSQGDGGRGRSWNHCP